MGLEESIRSKNMEKSQVKDALNARKRANYVYNTDFNQGLIEIWIYNNKYVLTWEECKHGDQFNENRYIKDERHMFDSFESLNEFLEAKGINIEAFEIASVD
jgi:hypothetical protein